MFPKQDDDDVKDPAMKHKPAAITKFLSRTALARKPSPIRVISDYLFNLPPDKEILTMAAGLPAASTFPLESMTIGLRDGSSFKIEGSAMSTALQYNKTSGVDGLRKWWSDLLSHLLSPPPHIERATIVTTGAEFGTYLMFNALIDPGDYVLLAEPIYCPNMLKVDSLNAVMVPIKEDPLVGGISPTALRHTLETWPEDRQKPKALLLCPTGCNPSGANVPEEARREIYRLACEFDFLILEDDPYYFLNYGKDLTTFLSMDTEGRVMRLDSLSKVLCPGLRIGFLTCPASLVPYLERHYSVTLLNSCNVSQVIAQTFFEKVGIDGFLEHATTVARHYKTQRDATEAALAKYMSDLGTWITPEAGMFLWVKLHGFEDTTELAKKAIDRGVAIVPGAAFQLEGGSPCIRLSFSVLPPDKIEEAVKSLAETIRIVKQEQ